MTNRVGKAKSWVAMGAGIVALAGGALLIMSQFFASSDLAADVKILEVKEEQHGEEVAGMKNDIDSIEVNVHNIELRQIKIDTNVETLLRFRHVPRKSMASEPSYRDPPIKPSLTEE